MEELLRAIIDPKSFNESVTVLGGEDILVTPLGVRLLDRRLLTVRVYPSTRLYYEHEKFYEACIAFPLTPEPYYKSVLHHHIELEPSKSLHTPCLKDAHIVIEAVITKRIFEYPFVYLNIEPVHIEVRNPPRAYNRSLGCSIELLIAYTRLRYWASQRKVSCKTIRLLVASLIAAYNCIKHTTENTEILEYASYTFSEALKYVTIIPCVFRNKILISEQGKKLVESGGARRRDTPESGVV